MQSTETWLPVVGYEGYYDVSDHGRVRSVARIVPAKSGQRNVPSVIRALAINAKGYQTVNLSTPTLGAKTWRVHNLVLRAFVGPCPEGEEARHVNGVPADNRLANLRWGTHSENNRDRVLHGTHPLAARTECLRGHVLDERNTYVNPSGYRSCRQCRRGADHQYRMRRNKPDNVDTPIDQLAD